MQYQVTINIGNNTQKYTITENKLNETKIAILFLQTMSNGDYPVSYQIKEIV